MDNEIGLKILDELNRVLLVGIAGDDKFRFPYEDGANVLGVVFRFRKIVLGESLWLLALFEAAARAGISDNRELCVVGNSLDWQ